MAIQQIWLEQDFDQVTLDTALGSEMAQPSIDLCKNRKLIFFEDATHWVQHEKLEDVNNHLLEFFRE